MLEVFYIGVVLMFAKVVQDVAKQRAATEEIAAQCVSVNDALNENNDAALRTSSSVGDLERLADKIHEEIQKYRI